MANSKLHPNYQRKGDGINRLHASASQKPLVQAAAQFLQQKVGNLQQIRDRQAFDQFWFEGQRYFLNVVPRRDEKGLNWLVAIAIPESDFMAQIHANTQMTIVACGIALVSVIALGYLTSRRITQPILRLSQATANIAAGELDQTVVEPPIGELKTLARSFNHMTQQLQDAFTTLEARVEERTAELSDALQHLQQTQAQLVQQEKMSSLGEMVAGIAHEINNPINFIHGNLTHTQQYSQDLLELLELYQQHLPHPPEVIQTKLDDVDLEFLSEDFSKIIDSMENGTTRIQSIVLSLRNFSRLDEVDVKLVNLHEGIESTLMILQNRLTLPSSARLEITKHYAELPKGTTFTIEIPIRQA